MGVGVAARRAAVAGALWAGEFIICRWQLALFRRAPNQQMRIVVGQRKQLPGRTASRFPSGISKWRDGDDSVVAIGAME